MPVKNLVEIKIYVSTPNFSHPDDVEDEVRKMLEQEGYEIYSISVV